MSQRSTTPHTPPSSNEISPTFSDIEEGAIAQRFNVYSSKMPRFYTEAEKEVMSSYESVDYWEPCSLVYKDHLDTRRSEPRSLIWLFIAVCAFCTAFITILFVSMLHGLQRLRLAALSFGILNFNATAAFRVGGAGFDENPERQYGAGYVMWLLISLLMIVLTCFIGKLFPGILGPGTPEVIALLNGVASPHVTKFRIFLGKFLVTLTSLASGLPVGFFGPIIQAGSMVGASLIARFWQSKTISYFRNPRDRRILVVVGSAIGVTGAFSVPLGGLMFVIEQVSAAFPSRLAYYVFAGCLCCAFLIQLFFSYFKAFGLRERGGIHPGQLLPGALVLYDTNLYVPGTSVIPMNFFCFFPALLLGLIGGVLGPAYIKLQLLAFRARRYLNSRWKNSSYVDTPILCFIYVTLTYWLAVSAFGVDYNASPSSGGSRGCENLPAEFLYTQNESVVRYYGLINQLCHAGAAFQVNSDGNSSTFVKPLKQKEVFHPFASLAFAFPDSSAQMLLSLNTENELSLTNLFVYLTLFFLFSALVSGGAISGDVLLPCLVIGAGIGRIVGVLTRDLALSLLGGASKDNIQWADPGVCALIGAGAFLSGTTRVTFSLAVILIELTDDFHHILPVMIAISVAKVIGDKLSHSIMEIHLEGNCYPMLDFTNQIQKYDMFYAKDIMARENLHVIPTIESIANLLNLVKSSPHNGFPTVFRDGTVKGLILKKQIRTVLWHVYRTKSLENATYEQLRDLEQQLYLERVPDMQVPPFSPEFGSVRIDLHPYMDTSAFCVQETMCLSRVYYLFQALGVRHLVVVKVNNLLSGIITRKDLNSAHIIERIVEENERRRALFGSKRMEDSQGGGGTSSSWIHLDSSLVGARNHSLGGYTDSKTNIMPTAENTDASGIGGSRKRFRLSSFHQMPPQEEWLADIPGSPVKQNTLLSQHTLRSPLLSQTEESLKMRRGEEVASATTTTTTSGEVKAAGGSPKKKQQTGAGSPKVAISGKKQQENFNVPKTLYQQSPPTTLANKPSGKRTSSPAAESNPPPVEGNNGKEGTDDDPAGTPSSSQVKKKGSKPVSSATTKAIQRIVKYNEIRPPSEDSEESEDRSGEEGGDGDKHHQKKRPQPQLLNPTVNRKTAMSLDPIESPSSLSSRPGGEDSVTLESGELPH